MGERRAGLEGSDPLGQQDASEGAQNSEGTQSVVAHEFEVALGAWSAPMPSPDMLDAYERGLPGSAERILAMTEKAATGRIDIDSRLADAEIDQTRTGLALAFTLSGVALVAAIVFFALHQPVAGGVLLSMPVVILIRSFLRS